MIMMNGGYEFVYLWSSPTFNAKLPVPRSLATEGGQVFCTSLFSLANKNLLPSGAGTDTVGVNNRFVLNTCTITVYDSDNSENSYKLFLASKAPSMYILAMYSALLVWVQSIFRAPITCFITVYDIALVESLATPHSCLNWAEGTNLQE